MTLRIWQRITSLKIDCRGGFNRPRANEFAPTAPLNQEVTYNRILIYFIALITAIYAVGAMAYADMKDINGLLETQIAPILIALLSLWILYHLKHPKHVQEEDVLEKLAKGMCATDVLDMIAQKVENISSGTLCSILSLDLKNKKLHNYASPNLPNYYIKSIDGFSIGKKPCFTPIYQGERFMIEDLRNQTDWKLLQELSHKEKLITCYFEPIKSSRGETLGFLAIYRRQPGKLSQEETKLIQHAAHLTHIAIERKNQEDALQLATLAFQSSSNAILVTDAKGKVLTANPAFSQITGYECTDIIGQNPRILKLGRHEPDFCKNLWTSLQKTGHWQGEVRSQSKDGKDIVLWLTVNTLQNERGKATSYIAVFSDITAKKSKDTLNWQQANYDTLTRLPNRRLFYDRLAQDILKTQRENLSLALLFIDLDCFKEVNDSLGHEIGDLLLVETAKRISECVRDSDTVARLGGDEFTVTLPEINEIDRAEQVAQAIIQSLAKPFSLKDEIVQISASIGITIFPNDAKEIEDLLKNADQAMYVAKSLGRNRYSYFTYLMQLKAQAREQIIHDLRLALSMQQFEVYFQPIVDLSNDGIIKAEALLRWHHPQRGMVSPVEFIPIAEEVGLISCIGDWVFKQAARQTKLWLDQGVKDIQISIKKSPVQFISGNSFPSWKAYLQEIGLLEKHIVIEITENVLIKNKPGICDQLHQIHDFGIQIAIDDFGKGCSSIMHLKKFNINYIKIDISFIKGLTENQHDRDLVEAIIAMSHKLGIKVIAEGVESLEEKRLLKACGCDYAQGYFFSRPLPAEKLASMFN